ncbi:DUF58 domain-containing protein [Wenzhouxiangella sp. XN79A]|uniref:DUF58 domain-containing protein n=1 Tax=Wenzhouxiangella sp. XN79A TaxID=2724193 RepID=UPI00144A7ECC|nr:DUF58 domain-containing protein [Wenzhouxiangella sp. XN79A]NKI33593.1 DUF58 domain-containing protein [Wenzhouxiangella sp. XN79A]
MARVFDGWLSRRGPTRPPLTLHYRQVFILPTAFGWMIALLLHGMLLGSLNFNNSMGLLTTFLLTCMGLLSLHLAYRNLEGVRVEAIHSEPVFAGQSAEVRIELRETSGRGRAGIVCLLPPDPPVEGVDLSASGTALAHLVVPTERRGLYPLGRIRVRTRQPLGLFEAWSWVHPRTSIRVWPRPAEPAPPRPEASSADRSNRPGDESDEFHGLRGWREGDSLHRIAWKASQRHDQLLARQFSRTERGRLVFRLDTVPVADVERRLSVLCRWVLDAERDGVDYGLDLGWTRLEPDHGPVHRNRCLDALAEHP